MSIPLFDSSAPENDGESSCCSAEAVRGARELAHRLGMAHLSIDLREEFRAGVVEPWLAGRAGGETPNPCVRCNGNVRLDAMLELGERLGAGTLATGHYARVHRGPLLRRKSHARFVSGSWRRPVWLLFSSSVAIDPVAMEPMAAAVMPMWSHVNRPAWYGPLIDIGRIAVALCGFLTEAAIFTATLYRRARTRLWRLLRLCEAHRSDERRRGQTDK